MIQLCIIRPLPCAATVERGRKRPTPARSVSHFCPSRRLFCSAVLLQQNVLTEPLKSWHGIQPFTQLLITTHTLQSNTYYIRLCFAPPPLFRSFYGILENLIERQRLNLYLWQKLNNAKIRTASWSRLKGHSILACKVQRKTYPEP